MKVNRSRWLLGGGAVLVAVMLFATGVLFTNIGAPSDEYSSMPHPCRLIEGPSLEELTGDVRLSQTLNTGPGRLRPGLERDSAERSCHGGPVGVDDGTIQSSVLLFYSAQFGLGRTGQEKASDQLVIHSRLFRDNYPDNHFLEQSDERGDAFGMYGDQSLRLHIQRANLYVSVDVRFQQPDQEARSTQPEQLLTQLAEQIRSQLDDEAVRLPTRGAPPPD